jgi:hypothetical protein
MVKNFQLLNASGSTVIPAGWSDILIIPSGSVTIYNTNNPTDTMSSTQPISFGTNRPNLRQWDSLTIVGIAEVIINGEANA